MTESKKYCSAVKELVVSGVLEKAGIAYFV
jgi:hypothetical protein